MKYKYLFDQLITKEYEKIQKGIIKSDDTNKIYEWRVIVSALKMPQEDETSLYHEFLKDVDIPIGQQDYIEMIRAVNLDHKRKRQYIKTMIVKMDEEIALFLSGDDNAAKSIEHFIGTLNERDQMEKRMYFKAKYLLCYLFCLDSRFASEEGKVVLTYCMEPFCAKILRLMYKQVSKEMGMHTDADQMNSMMENTRNVIRVAENEVEKQDMESLRFQIMNYRNTLELVEAMFDELKESMDDSVREAKKSAIEEFFTSLNSSEYGNILDNILVVEQRLSQIRQNHTKIQPEMMPLAIIFKQLNRFIEECGIKPIEKTGRTFVGLYNDIAQMNYEGEPYTNDTEQKKLKVVSPGWKYKDIIISLPTVREV